MELVQVIAAAIAAWIFGAVWYGIIGKQWMDAVGLTEETINRKNIVAFVGSFVCAILVAGMMRHVFASMNIGSLGSALISGFGLGFFIASPWIVTNYLFAQKPIKLMIIDATYATVGCSLMGVVLYLL